MALLEATTIESIKKANKIKKNAHNIMTNLLHLPWYYLILYLVVGMLILWIFDKYQFIKSKSLRYFIVMGIYTLIFWIIYDLVVAS